LGFARAVNLAVKEVKYNYVYLLNNDMEVQVGFFKEMIKTANALLKKEVNFFAIASQIFFHDQSVKRVESGKTWTSFKHGKLLVGHELDPQKLKGLSLTAYGGGGSSLVSADLFNRLGGFDHSVYTPMYSEDLDLGFVAWKKGYPSFFCPKSHVIHHHRSSSKLLPVSPDYYLHKNFLSFCLKNLNSFTLKFQLFLFYPFYLVFKKDYWRYLLDNLKNYQNIVKSKKKSNKLPDVYQDTDLINFFKFEKKYGSKYKI
jgi:GT2 family glycosyltransferase